jgi:hypothetical protein
MLIGYKRGQGSIVLRIKILNSSVATGAGLTGLSSTSSGLIISTIADNEATATAYTVAASNVETVTTLGTFAAPTAGKCRFREVDSTNHKGVYEIQLADARYAVSNAKSLLVSVLGATNAAETDVVIPLRDLDPFSSVRSELAVELARIDTTIGSRLASAGYTTPPTSAAIADAVLDDAVEGSETLRQAVRLIRAAAVGKLSGAATTEITIRDAADTKARITATVDSNGNRSAVTTDAT